MFYRMATARLLEMLVFAPAPDDPQTSFNWLREFVDVPMTIHMYHGAIRLSPREGRGVR
jgi:hypothetical protein